MIRGILNREGVQVRDARKTQTLWVKPQDIKGAICGDHQECAIARALKRQLGAKLVDVSASTVLVSSKTEKKCYRFTLPASARKQVRFFDTNDGAFAPCKLMLAPPYTAKIKLATGSKQRKKWTSKGGTRQKPTR